MKKKEIWISDLTHTAQGITSHTFPLGVSLVYSYAKQELGKEFNFELFKFPSQLSDAMNKKSPAMLCFSNFSWNLELGYKFAHLAKLKNLTRLHLENSEVSDDTSPFLAELKELKYFSV